jgi:hypothetical protein
LNGGSENHVISAYTGKYTCRTKSGHTYLRSSLNPPKRCLQYIPEDIKFGKYRSIRITFVQMSNVTQSANRRCAENEGRSCGTFLSVRVPRAEAVKNWSDESAFSTADVEERVLSVLRHTGVYMGIVQIGRAHV